MWIDATLTLDQAFGSATTAKLTAVYGDVLADVTRDRLYSATPRSLRLTIVTALLAEAERGETDCDRLKAAALVALAGYDDGPENEA
jgi:hypothetical protein